MMRIELNSIDRHLAGHLAKLCGSAGRKSVYYTALLLSHLHSRGHICFSIREYAKRTIELSYGDATENCTLPALEDWIGQLLASPVVGSELERKPIIFLKKSTDVYLYRYWSYEQALISAIRKRALAAPEKFEQAEVAKTLQKVFESSAEEERQVQAAYTALSKRLCVISGGPGTGKTTTVVKILVLLLQRNPAGKIALAAPTGKAAMRLKESVMRGKRVLEGKVEASILDRIPDHAGTLHRLLGYRARSTAFRYHRDNPLPVDFLIVDEASMIDLALMSRLFQALPDGAKTILLGDRNQLSSVEAGMVFGDICATRSKLIRDHIVQLTKSYRFNAHQGIGLLSRHILSGKGETGYRMLADRKYADQLATKTLPSASQFKTLVAEYISPYLERYFAKTTIADAFSLYRSHMILCALKKGPYGADNLNRIIEQSIFDRQLIPHRQEIYSGKPIIVTQNDYHLHLFNGDIGIYWFDPETQRFCVFFETAEGWRKISPSRMPNHDTAYATTVHKSQGSEYDKIVLVLPETDDAPLTRELAYTAATRAKRFVEVWSTRSAFINTVARTTQRKTGLASGLMHL